jgi:4-amino-4-deoxy-L-arabinose transferase-like glycosyltransferase
MADELFHFDYVVKLSKGDGLIHVYNDPIEDEVFDFAVDTGHWAKERIVTPVAKGGVTFEMLESIRRWGWYDTDLAGGHSYEGVQPPLYYAVAAIPVSLFEPMAWKAVAARSVSVIFSALTLVASFFVILKVSKSRFISLGAVVLLVAAPAWRFESFRIGNDIASKAMIMLVFLFFLILHERKKEVKVKWAIVLGFAVGLAALTRLDAAITLAPLLLGSYLLLSKAPLKKRVLSFMVVLVLAMIVSGPFYLRNQTLYGDFSGAHAIIEAIYIDKDLDKAPNILTAAGALLRFSTFFLFSPYLDKFEVGVLRVAGVLWLMALSILVTSLIVGFIPRYRRMLALLAPVTYLLLLFVVGALDLIRILLAVPLFLITSINDSTLKPQRFSLLLLFLISTAAVGAGSIYYLTYVGPISERYVLGAAPFGAAMVILGIQSVVMPQAQRLFLAILVLALTVASFTQQVGQIEWLMRNLRP